VTEQTPEPAFVMGDGDRFHAILVSDSVRYDAEPGVETVLTFFIIRHGHGFSIHHVLKTFREDKCISRLVQTKKGISQEKVESESTAIREVFSHAVEAKSGVKLRWHELNLRLVESSEEQVRLIKAWGRVNVWTE